MAPPPPDLPDPLNPSELQDLFAFLEDTAVAFDALLASGELTTAEYFGALVGMFDGLLEKETSDDILAAAFKRTA